MCNHQLWEGKRSQNGQRKKKSQRIKYWRSWRRRKRVTCYKTWVTHDHESVNHPVVACRGSTETTGVNTEILIAAQGKQLEKTPSPSHSAALLTHADSHALDPPRPVKPWSFYPCFDRRVVVSRFKKLWRPRQHTKSKGPPIAPLPTRYTTNISNLPSTMLSLLSSSSPRLKDESRVSAKSRDSTRPFRTYQGVRFTRSHIYLTIEKLTNSSVRVWSLANTRKNILKSPFSCYYRKNICMRLRFIAKFQLC